MTVDARWQPVTCKNCGKQYICTPSEDYYALRGETLTSLEDGLCWDCFMAATGMKPQPEPLRYAKNPFEIEDD